MGTAAHENGIADPGGVMNLAPKCSDVCPPRVRFTQMGEALRLLATTLEGDSMRGSDGAAMPRVNVWIALAGLLLLGALAFGLVQSGANATAPVSAGGYGGATTGTGNGKAPCRHLQNGYQVPCASDARSVSTTPASPTAGKGFKVSFKSTSGGAYKVVAKHKKTSKVLEQGATGAGKTTTKKVGKGLKAGSWTMVVTVTSSGKPDTAKHSITISK
jgi:hypothetical protein